MDHPNVISLKHCFFSTTSKNELFLNLVMEYVPETMYRVLKHYSNANQRMPLIYVKLYMYQVYIWCKLTDLFFNILPNANKGIVQIFRGLAYIHAVPGVCHRDLKPQNLLVCSLLIIPWRKKLWFTSRNLSGQHLCTCTIWTYYIRFYYYDLWLIFWVRSWLFTGRSPYSPS